MTKEELYKYYVAENHSRTETAAFFNTTETKIKQYCSIWEIIKRTNYQPKKIILDKDLLYEYYVIGNHSEENTAKYFNCSITVLEKNLKKHQISKHGIRAKQKVKYPSKEYLEDLYLKRKLTCKEIGKLIGYCERTVPLILKYYSIPMRSIKDRQEKARKTYFEKTGYKAPGANPEVQNKIKKTNLKRYGGLPQQTQEYKQKLSIQLKSRSKEEKQAICNKRKQTNLERYGYEHNLQSPEVKEKIRKTNIERYGVASYNRQNFNPIYNKWVENYDLFIKWLKEHQEPKLTIWEIANFIDCSYSVAQKLVKKAKAQQWVDYAPMASKEEKEIRHIFEEAKIPFISNSREIVSPKELDMYFPEHNFAIEYNGNYYHSELNLDRFYHQRKSLECAKHGIQLFHIFEYEWLNERKRPILIEKLQNHLNINRTTIYACDCSVCEIDIQTKSDFLNSYHLKGDDNSSVCYGLYHENTLMSVMTFSQSRNHDWELSRYACKAGCIIVGGAGKLFKKFTCAHKGTIVAYSDLAKESGEVYKELGFKFEYYTQPRYVWCEKHTNEIKTQNDNKNECFKIYDCGNKVWIYNNL